MRRASNLSVFAFGILLVLAACSSGPDASATPSPDASTPTPEAEPSEDVGAALPSLLAGAGDLSGLVPVRVGDYQITYRHMSGADPAFLEDLDDDARDFLERFDAEPSDITTAFGFGGGFDPGSEFVGISAFRVAGADETRLRDTYMTVLQEQGGDMDLEFQPATVAGKDVYRFGDTREGDVSALYSHGDMLWIVFASTADLLEDALIQLP